MARPQRGRGGPAGGTASVSLKDGLARHLREFFTSKYAPRIEVKNAARVIVYPPKKDGTPSKKYLVMYRCAACQQLSDEVDVDHIEPVDMGFSWPPVDDTELTRYLKRLLCDKSNLQVLCKPCHWEKCAIENAGRKERQRLRRKKRAKKKPN